ncbi:MAG: type II secretion system protein [Desulfamplus sp.]
MLNIRCLISFYSISVKGVTLIELIAAMAIISILATGIMPLSKMAYKRSREIELRQALRTVRTALDKYKRDADEKKIVVPFNSTGYPKTLEELVDGVPSLVESGRKRKYLRRIPRDPMTEDGTWNMRSYADEPDSTIWSGEDVYDVYSKSDKSAIDGTFYKDW